MKTFDSKESTKYRKIYGALAAPGKGRGFAVIVGKEKLAAERVVLLEEIEAGDIRQLVRECAALDYFYHPEVWFGDTDNPTLTDFIREANKDNEAPGDRPFKLRRTKLLDKKNDLFSYILPMLRNLIERGHLILKDGMTKTFLSQPQEADLSTIEMGDYPSIEALAFAVLEIDQDRNVRRVKRQNRANNEYSRI